MDNNGKKSQVLREREKMTFCEYGMKQGYGGGSDRGKYSTQVTLNPINKIKINYRGRKSIFELKFEA